MYIDLRPGRAAKIGNAPMSQQVHPVEEYQNYNFDRGWVEWVQLWRPQEEGGVELLYNSAKTGSQLVWRPDPLVTRCCRESQQSGPPGLRLSSPGKRERNSVMANRVRVNMLLFCSVSNSLSHTNLLNKARGIVFLRTVSLVVFIGPLCIACICRCIYIMCLYSWS